MKASAISHPNIAFSKYWGKFDDALTLPMNDSISMTLANLATITTVELSPDFASDSVFLSSGNEQKFIEQTGSKKARAVQAVQRLIKLAAAKAGQAKLLSLKAKVYSHNNFPMGAGIASSASAFSALTLATVEALDLFSELKGTSVYEKELSIQTRLAGSGSACRSIAGGFVKWQQAEASADSFAQQLYDENYWDLVDLICVVDEGEKSHSSLEGHSLAKTSPYYQTRLREVKKINHDLELALERKDFTMLGAAIESEMLALHFLAMTSKPAIFYWSAATIEILKAVQNLRQTGTEVYATLDAGANVHLLIESSNTQKVSKYFSEAKLVEDFPLVKEILTAPIGSGAKIIKQALF